MSEQNTKFEVWYESRFGKEGLKTALNHTYLKDGEYVYESTKDKLLIWQAATAEANKRIAALEGEVAELQRDRDEWKDSTISANRRFEIAENDVYKYQVETANMSLEIMQLQKNNHDLLEALEIAKISSCSCLTKTPEHKYHDSSCRYRIYCEALSATPAESLQAFENSVIEKIINIIKSEIDKFNNVDSLLYIIEILDNMKVNHETTKTP